MAHDVLPEGVGAGAPEPARLTRDWPLWLLLALDWAVAAWSLPRLPDPTPLHWNLHGTVDRWGSPAEAAFLLPVCAVAGYLIALGLSALQGRGREASRTPGEAVRQTRWILVTAVSGIHLALLMSLVQGGTGSPRWLFLPLALLLMFVGNLLPRVEPGLRPSAPPEVREAWRGTYRAAGRFLVGAGLVQACTFWLPPAVFAGVLAGSLLLAVFAPFVLLSSRLRHLRTQASEPPAQEGHAAGPLLSPHDGAAFAGLAGLLLLQRILGPDAIGAPLRWVIPGLLAAWAVLLADAARPTPQEVRRTANLLRGWLILGLATGTACLGLPFGRPAVPILTALVAVHLFPGLAQAHARHTAPEAARDQWGEGPMLWDADDPRVIVPKGLGLGWSYNFARGAAWVLLLGMLGLVGLAVVQSVAAGA